MRVCSYLFFEVVIYWKTSVFQIQIEGDCFETLNYAEHFEKLASHQHFWITSVFLNFLLPTMKIWPLRTKKYNVPEESFQPLAICFFSCFWIVCWFCSNVICGKKLQISYRVLSEYNTNFTALVNKEMYGSHERVVNWILKVKGARNTNLDVALDWVIDSQVLSPIQTVIIVDNSYNYTQNCI